MFAEETFAKRNSEKLMRENELHVAMFAADETNLRSATLFQEMRNCCSEVR